MAKNGTINKTAFTDTAALGDTSELKVKAIHVTELQTALEQLTAYAVNVDNCGNCVYCQTCQGCQTCQVCQSTKCQSSSCQTCQSISQCSSRNCTCQTRGQCDCNCSGGNCNCSDDSGGGP